MNEENTNTHWNSVEGGWNTSIPELEGHNKDASEESNTDASEMDNLHGSQEKDSSAGSEEDEDDIPPPPPLTSLQTKCKALNLMMGSEFIPSKRTQRGKTGKYNIVML